MASDAGTQAEGGILKQAPQRLRGDVTKDHFKPKDHFEPKMVSIGIFHRDLHPHEIKESVADSICRPGGERRKKVLAELKKQLESTPSKNGSEWYDNSVDASKKEEYFFLPKTDSSSGRVPLLDDGCYVLSLLQDFKAEDKKGKKDKKDVDLVSKDLQRYEKENRNELLRDILFLLENQIPWSVLREMYRCFVGETRDKKEKSRTDREPIVDPEKALAKHVRLELERRLYTISGGGRRPPVPLPPSPGPTHLLDLVHHYLKPTAQEGGGRRTNNTDDDVFSVAWRWLCRLGAAADGSIIHMGRWRRATEYRRYAFVELKRRGFKTGEVESVLDVRLKGRTLWIPTLRIDPVTCTLLRNLIALEAATRMEQRPVTAYCIFMSQLACKVEDVELLQRLGILQNFLATDEDVVQGFANLCSGVVLHVDDPEINYLNGTWHQLQEKCQKPGYTFCGLFFDKYCSDSLSIVTFMVAFTVFAYQVVLHFYPISKQSHP